MVPRGILGALTMAHAVLESVYSCLKEKPWAPGLGPEPWDPLRSSIYSIYTLKA